MIRRLLSGEEANAVLVLVLGTTAMVLAANGPGRVSPGRALSAVLSNPVPRHETNGVRAGVGRPSATGRGAAA